MATTASSEPTNPECDQAPSRRFPSRSPGPLAGGPDHGTTTTSRPLLGGVVRPSRQDAPRARPAHRGGVLPTRGVGARPMCGGRHTHGGRAALLGLLCSALLNFEASFRQRAGGVLAFVVLDGAVDGANAMSKVRGCWVVRSATKRGRRRRPVALGVEMAKRVPSGVRV